MNVAYVNKMIGAILGGVVGLAVYKFGLEGVFGQETVDAIVAALTPVLGSALGTFFAPKNSE